MRKTAAIPSVGKLLFSFAEALRLAHRIFSLAGRVRLSSPEVRARSAGAVDIAGIGI